MLTSLMWRGSRVNNGSIANGRSASTTKSTHEPDIHARQLVGDLIDLGNHDPAAESGRFDNRWRVLGIWPSKKVSVPIPLRGANQGHIRDQIDEHPSIELDVGMDRSNLQAAIFKQLGDPQTLRAGIREIDFSRDPVLEEIKVLAPADT